MRIFPYMYFLYDFYFPRKSFLACYLSQNTWSLCTANRCHRSEAKISKCWQFFFCHPQLRGVVGKWKPTTIMQRRFPSPCGSPGSQFPVPSSISHFHFPAQWVWRSGGDGILFLKWFHQPPTSWQLCKRAPVIESEIEIEMTPPTAERLAIDTALQLRFCFRLIIFGHFPGGEW